MARQRLGQHFLEDAGWREQIARAIGVSPHSTSPSSRERSTQSVSGSAHPKPTPDQSYCWIEVGAGHGEMTEHLLSTGAAVYAIELDAILAASLQRRVTCSTSWGRLFITGARAIVRPS